MSTPETVKEKNEERLMRLANVTGVGIGEKGRGRRSLRSL